MVRLLVGIQKTIDPRRNQLMQSSDQLRHDHLSTQSQAAYLLNVGNYGGLFHLTLFFR